MQRFYFDINDGRRRTTDSLGEELPSLDHARKMAVRELAHLIRDDMADGQRESYVVTVRDAGGVPVYVATATMLAEPL